MKKIFRCITFSILLMLIYQSSAFALQKNVTSQKWIVFAFTTSTNAPALDDEAQITATLNIDGGADNAVDDTNPAELGRGYYVFDLSQAETNGDYILIRPDSSTSGIEVIGCPAAVWTTALGFNASVAQTGDSYAIVNSGTYGNSALNTAIGTRSTLTAQNVWEYATRILTANTNLNDLNAAAIAAAVWNAATGSYGTAGTYGLLIETDLDAAISTRGTSTLTAANVWDADISAYSGAKAGTYLKSIYDKLPAGTIGTSTLTASDNIGINWADVAAPTTAVNLSGTNIKTDQVVASVSGAVGSVTGAVGSVTGAVGSVTGGVTVTTNNDKTGYALTQAFPTNFANLSISATTGLVDITQTAADKVWGTTARVLTAGTNLSLLTAQQVWEYATRVLTAGTNLNNIAASDVVSAMQLVADDFKADVSSLATATDISDLQTHGDSTWATATGFSTLTAQQVWEYTTRVLTAGTNIGFPTATNIWQTDISEYSTSGYAGTYLKAAGGAADPWLTNLPGAYSAGTAGYIIGTNLNATISSRGTSTHSAADVAALILLTPANKLATDSSNRVTVGSNADKTGYTASTVSDKTGYSLTQTFPTNFPSLAITAGGAVTAGTVSDKTGYYISGTKTTLDSLNDITAASVWGIATRTLTAGAYAGLTEADVDAIWNELQSGHSTPGSFGLFIDSKVSEAGGGGLSVQDIVDGVWDELLASHLTSGSTGKKLNESPNPYNVGP